MSIRVPSRARILASRSLGRCSAMVCAEDVAQLLVAVQRPQVEAQRGPGRRLGVGALGPGGVGRAPGRERLAEGLGRGVDAVLRVAEAALLERADGAAGQALVVGRGALGVGRLGVGVDQPVVLPRPQHGLPPAGGAEGEPGPAAVVDAVAQLGRQLGLDGLEHLALELVVDLGDEVEQVLGVDALVVEPVQAPAGVGAQASQLLDRLRPLQALGRRDGVEPAVVAHVLGREQAAQAAVLGVHDDDASDPLAHHRPHGVEQPVVGRQRDRRAVDQAHDRPAGVGAGGEHALDQVALGHDPHRDAVLDHHDGVGLHRGHGLGRLQDRGPDRHRRRLRPEHVAERGVEEQERARGVDVLVEHPDVALDVGVEVGLEALVGVDEPLEAVGGDERARGLLDGPGLVRGGAALEQPVGPELGPGPGHVDGPAGLGLLQPHQPLGHDVERAVDVVALLEDELAGGVELERHLLEQRLALVVGEHVERLGLGQEAGDLGGEGGHAAGE